jgi:hypothetical protein
MGQQILTLPYAGPYADQGASSPRNNSLTPRGGSQDLPVIRQPTFQGNPRYQPLVIPPTEAVLPIVDAQGVVITVNGISHLQRMLDGLSPEAEINVFRQLQRQIMDGVETLEAIADQILEIIETRSTIQNLIRANRQEFDNEFVPLRQYAQNNQKRRRRIEEAEARLLDGFISPEFYQNVVLQQARRTTAVLDALHAARTTGISPALLFSRASGLRLQRLARLGPYQKYGSNDLTITPRDITLAADPNQKIPFFPPREDESAKRYHLAPDSTGIHWLNGEQPAGINEAYQNLGFPIPRQLAFNSTPPQNNMPSASQVATFGSSQPRGTSRTPTPHTPTPAPPHPRTSTTGSPASRTSTPKPPAQVTQTQLNTGVVQSIEGGQRPNTRPQAVKPDYAGQQGKSEKKPPKRPRPQDVSPPPPAHAASRPTNQDAATSSQTAPVQIGDLIGRIRTLSIDAGRARVDPSSLKSVPNPVKNPSPLEQAIWNHANRKAEAISQSRQLPPLSREQEKQLGLMVDSIPDLHNSIQHLTEAVRGSLGPSHVSLSVYLEGLADGAAAAYAAFELDRHAVGELRVLVSTLRRRIDNGFAQIGNGNENTQGIRINVHDFESFLLDENNSGWLNQMVIMGALLGMARDPFHRRTTFIVNSDAFLHFRTGTLDHIILPDTPQNMVIPMHWGDHWTVGLVDYENRTIHHMDSSSNPRRHREGIDAIRQLLAHHQHIFGVEEWTQGTITSGQQTNTWDCGIWAIENARWLIEGSGPDMQPVIGPMTRFNIAQEFYRHLIQDTPAPNGPTQREREVAAARQYTQDPTNPDAIRYIAPGPDMPHIGNIANSRQAQSIISIRSQTPTYIAETPVYGRQSPVFSPPYQPLGTQSPARSRQSSSPLSDAISMENPFQGSDNSGGNRGRNSGGHSGSGKGSRQSQRLQNRKA